MGVWLASIREAVDQLVGRAGLEPATLCLKATVSSCHRGGWIKGPGEMSGRKHRFAGWCDGKACCDLRGTHPIARSQYWSSRQGELAGPKGPGLSNEGTMYSQVHLARQRMETREGRWTEVGSERKGIGDGLMSWGESDPPQGIHGKYA